jgi:hypothetical protein
VRHAKGRLLPEAGGTPPPPGRPPGLGERTADLVDLLHDLPDLGRSEVESLLRGYRDGGGNLGEADLLFIHDVLVCDILRTQVQEERSCRLEEALARVRFLLDF